MTAINDPWLFQEELRQQIEGCCWKKIDGFLCVRTKVETYVESFMATLVPLSKAKLSRSIANTSWGDEFDWAKPAIHGNRIRHAHQSLSRSFKLHSKLKGGDPRYWDKDDKIGAHLDTYSHEPGEREDLWVRIDLVREFLVATNRTLVCLLTAQRYTERSLPEFGAKEVRYEEHKGERFAYAYDQATHPNPIGIGRPRIRTFTQVHGKMEIDI